METPEIPTIEIEVGMRVLINIDSKKISKGWEPEALLKRKNFCFGTVVNKSNGHGLCFGVKHDKDQTIGYYDPHELIVFEKETKIIIKESETSERKTCPCEFGTPCRPNCTCGNPYLSAGCSRCCKYGSVEQRTAIAKYIIEKEEDYKRLLKEEKERKSNEDWVGGQG